VHAQVRGERLEEVDSAVAAIAVPAAALQVGQDLAVDVLARDEELGHVGEHVVPLEREQLLGAQPGVREHRDDERASAAARPSHPGSGG
jgi:hypothetical protein